MVSSRRCTSLIDYEVSVLTVGNSSGGLVSVRVEILLSEVLPPSIVLCSWTLTDLDQLLVSRCSAVSIAFHVTNAVLAIGQLVV